MAFKLSSRELKLLLFGCFALILFLAAYGSYRTYELDSSAANQSAAFQRVAGLFNTASRLGPGNTVGAPIFVSVRGTSLSFSQGSLVMRYGDRSLSRYVSNGSLYFSVKSTTLNEVVLDRAYYWVAIKNNGGNFTFSFT